MVLLAVLPLALAGAATAAPVVQTAADTLPKVDVQISNITPLAPGPKDTLRITGRVVNEAGPDLSAVQVSLHLSPRAVASRTELHDLRAHPVPQNLYGEQHTVATGNLAAGHSLPFTISVTIKQLQDAGLLPGTGVYPMQVTAIGATSPGLHQIDLATASTFLPYIPRAEAQPATPVAWLVPLTAPPSMLADGTLTSDGSKQGTAVVSAVSPGGRLRKLLDALPHAKAVTATLDPTVIQALAIAGTGSYSVTAVPGKPATRYPKSADAVQWLADLRGADRVSLIGLPYANVDVESAAHAHEQSLLADALAQGNEVLSLGLQRAAGRLLPNVAVPPGGEVDSTGARYYRTAMNADGLVLSGNAVPATGDNPSASATVPSVDSRLLLVDNVLTQLATLGPGDSPRVAEQEIIAELAESHIEDRFAAPPAGAKASAGRPLLIAPPAGWNPSTSWLSALLRDTAKLPWMSQVSVGDLLDSPAEPRAGLLYPATARSAELPPFVVRGSAQIESLAGGLFATSLPANTPQPRTPASIVRPIRDAALSASSAWLRSRLVTSATFSNSAQATLQNLQSAGARRREPAGHVDQPVRKGAGHDRERPPRRRRRLPGADLARQVAGQLRTPS